MNIDALIAKTHPPPDRIISGDVLCIGCGYNLRTKAVADRCPECGRDVADSLAGFPAAAGLALAMRLFHVEFLLGAIAWALVFTCVGIWLSLFLYPVVRIWMWGSGWVLWRRVTDAGADVRGAPPWANAVLVATAGGMLLDLVTGGLFLAMALEIRRGREDAIAWTVAILTGVAWVRIALYGRVCGRLAARVQRPKLESAARWGSALFAGSGVVLGLAALLVVFEPGWPNWAFTVVGILSSLAGLTALGGMIALATASLLTRRAMLRFAFDPATVLSPPTTPPADRPAS